MRAVFFVGAGVEHVYDECWTVAALADPGGISADRSASAQRNSRNREFAPLGTCRGGTR